MDKRLKLFAISLTSIISATTLGVGVSHFSDNIAFITRATEKTTEITLDSSEKPVIGNDGNGTLTYIKNNFASFSYTGASVFETGHVSLADGGTIVKNQASNNLKTFTANFTGGSLKLQTGYTGIDVDDVCYEYSLTSGTTLDDVGGNYFKLISTGTTNISEIEIVFGCEAEVDEPTHTYESEWTTNETHHWHECTDEHCVRKGGEANHTFNNVPQVDPTETETGFTAGTVCSVCGYVKSGREILPVLDQQGNNYDFQIRTTKVGDIVADYEEYTWKQDESVVIYANPTNPLETYIHAGNSYYSLNRWNELFPDAQATADNGVLTINLTGDTTVTAEDGGLLDGQLDLMLYDSVVINGSGSLTVAYAQEIDGIEAWNLTIEEGATVNLIGANEAKKTGFKVYGTLQIDGIANVSKYGHAVGFNTDKAGSSSGTFALNVGSTAKLNIDQAGNGISVWNTPSGGASINVNGKLTMTKVSNKGIYLESPVNVNFNDGCNVDLKVTGSSDSEAQISELTSVAIETKNNNTGSKDDNPAAAINFNGGTVKITSGDIGIKANEKMNHYFNGNVVVNITADKVGIYAYSNSSDDNNLMKLSGNSSLTINSKYGSGIYCRNGGCFKIEDNSKLEITAASSGIYGFRMLRVYNGSKSGTNVNTASLIVHSASATGSAGGKTSTGYAIYGRTNNSTDIGFRSSGIILVENTSSTVENTVGLHAGNKKDAGGNFVVGYCSNFTIKNFNIAMAITTSNPKLVTIYYNRDNDEQKIDIVDCTSVSSGHSSFTDVFKSSTCNVINN